MSHLSLSFLGGFEAILNAEPITTFGSDKVRSLLAFLAINSTQPHRRAVLAALFWPELSAKKAAHNLSQSLLRLRQALREKEEPTRAPFLIITPQTVQFNICSDQQLDVNSFRALIRQANQHQHPHADHCDLCIEWLSQAVELYRGDLLSGLFVSDSIAFEEWRLVEQEALHGQAMNILTRLIAYHQQRSEWERVQELARRQLALEPLHEEAHLQLMQALANSGQTTIALRQYESLQRTLAQELGIQPSVEITRVYETILSGENHLERPRSKQPPEYEEAAWLSSHGERRQVTALVCSRGIPGDEDENLEQTGLCERHCEGIFRHFGGQRAQRQGETCLVYFGYPQAYEDAARRAVHSGLAMAQAPGEDGPARIGIHTGVMLVGEQRGQRWQDRDLVGKALEIARDCQRLAQPGAVVISGDTRRLVQEFFELQLLKRPDGASPAGAEAMLIYQVQGESNLQSRLEWLAQTQHLSAFIGRLAELDQLHACHQHLAQGKGQVVLLRGEPGIGKSRLLWEFQNSILTSESAAANTASVRWLTSRCLPYNQNTSLYPVIELLEQLLGFQADDSRELRQKKLAAALARYGLEQPSAAWLLALLLSIPSGGAAESEAALVTKDQRRQMREVFIALVQKMAAQQPLVLVIEDLHWSDLSTVDWIGQSLSSLASAACLLVLSARPGFQPAWLADQNLLQISLQPLSAEQAEIIVSDLAGEHRLADAIRQRIVAQTDGNPLFIEELTKMLLERPLTQGSTPATLDIPVTLRDSLVVRLDHLGMGKETAQWAAVLGREFPYAILQASVPYDEQRLQSDLARLIEAELVSPLQAAQQEAAPWGWSAQGKKTAPGKIAVQAHYLFKHALVQEVAYVSLLKHTRQSYHRRVAETMETHFPQMVELRPEVLAQHYASAGMQSKAVDFWLRAGEHALAQGAALEAKSFFDSALDGIEPGETERRWRAMTGRERVYQLLVEREAQQREIIALLELAESTGDNIRRAQAWLNQMNYDLRWGNHQLALRAAESLRAAAQSAGSLNFEARALGGKIQVLTILGDLAEAEPVAREIMEKLPMVTEDKVRASVSSGVAFYYRSAGDLSRALQLAYQAAQAAHRAGQRGMESRIDINIGYISMQLGLYSQARTALEEGLALAEATGDRGLPTVHQNNLAYLHWCMGSRDQAIALGERTLRENREMGYNLYNQAACLAYLGFFMADAGKWGEAAAYLAEARSGYTRAGNRLDAIDALSVEARCLVALGQKDEARQMANEVWAYLREHGSAGIDFPGRVYVSLSDVVGEIEIPGITSRELIEIGYSELIQRAEKVSNVAWRRSFLKNVPANRELIERWENIHQADIAE